MIFKHQHKDLAMPDGSFIPINLVEDHIAKDFSEYIRKQYGPPKVTIDEDRNERIVEVEVLVLHHSQLETISSILSIMEMSPHTAYCAAELRRELFNQ